MINRIMKIGVAAVALAASALLAPTATAQNGARFDRGVSANQLSGGAVTFRDRNVRRTTTRRHSPRLNAFGQTLREYNFLAEEAAYACTRQLKLDGHKYGFEDAGFRSTPHIEQVGKRRFVIKGTAKLFDGYNYSAQHYECGVQAGSIRRATNLTPARFASRRRGNGIVRLGFSFGIR